MYKVFRKEQTLISSLINPMPEKKTRSSPVKNSTHLPLSEPISNVEKHHTPYPELYLLGKLSLLPRTITRLLARPRESPVLRIAIRWQWSVPRIGRRG